MVMERIPIVASVSDLPAAIEHGERVPASRWFIMRRATILKAYDQIPQHWIDPNAMAASALVASAGISEKFGPDEIFDSLRHELIDFVTGDLEMESLTASIKDIAWAAHQSEVPLENDAMVVVSAFTAAGQIDKSDCDEIVEAITAAARYVRTPAGAEHFGQPVGSVIEADVIARLPLEELIAQHTDGGAEATLEAIRKRKMRLEHQRRFNEIGLPRGLAPILSSGVRHVRTAEGAEYYGQPIGSVIVPNVYLPLGSKAVRDLKVGDFISKAGKGGEKRKVHSAPVENDDGTVSVNVVDEDGDTKTVKMAGNTRWPVYKAAPKGAKATLGDDAPKAKITDETFATQDEVADDTAKRNKLIRQIGTQMNDGEMSREGAEETLSEAGYSGTQRDNMIDIAVKRHVTTTDSRLDSEIKDASLEDLKALLEDVQDRDDPDEKLQQSIIDEIDKREGYVTKTDDETEAVALADIAADTSPAARIKASKAAIDAQRTKANALPSGTGPDGARSVEFNKLRDLMADHKALVNELGDAGQGNLIPDDGNTIRVRNKAQKILLEEELQGQISDGMWENSSPDWEDWSGADVIVDPENVGRNWYARKDNYQLNSNKLLDIVGDRMRDSVAAVQGHYDMQTMRKDLSDLRKIFKTKRPTHTEADVAETIERDAENAHNEKYASKTDAAGLPLDDAPIGEVVPTPSTPPAQQNFIDDRSASIGTIKPDAKGNDPERFTPKVSLADGATPASGQRVRDKKGRLGTVEETYQAYTAVRWDDTGKTQTVKNDRLNATGATGPVATDGTAAGKAGESTKKAVDNSPTTDVGGAAQLPDTRTPNPIATLTDKSHELFKAFFDDAGNWSGTPWTDGNVGTSKEDRGNLTDLKRKQLLKTGIDDGDAYVYFTDKGLAYARAEGWDMDGTDSYMIDKVEGWVDPNKPVEAPKPLPRWMTEVPADNGLKYDMERIEGEELHSYTVAGLLDTRDIGLAEIEEAEAEAIANKSPYRPTVMAKEPSYTEVDIPTDVARYALGLPKRVPIADNTAGSQRSSAQLIASGVTGKELRDALRRENPTWTNSQVYAVANSMSKKSGLTASGAEPTELEIMRVRTALRQFTRKIGLA